MFCFYKCVTVLMLTNHIHKFCISIQKTIKESAAYIPFNNSDDFSALQKCPKIKILNQQMKREILTRLSAWCLQYITVLLHRFSCGEHTYIPCSIEMYMLHKNCRHGTFSYLCCNRNEETTWVQKRRKEQNIKLSAK